jgi:hypothetical protein
MLLAAAVTIAGCSAPAARLPRAGGSVVDTVNVQVLRSSDLVHWTRVGDG